MILLFYAEHVYDDSRPGHVVAGPAIIWTPITTVVVQASQAATIDGHRNVVIRPAEAT